MRAAMMDGFGAPLKMSAIAVPEPGSGQILVRLETCGVCHTDVHIWDGHVRADPACDPFVLGHEGIGRVVALGQGVGDWRIGERIGVPWMYDACGVCDECVEGAESFCQRHRAYGFNVPGCFAEFVIADARYAVRLPEHIDPVSTAPLMCAGVTAYGAIRRAAVKSGDTVAIFGCGGLGLYAVQMAVRTGANVIAIDRDPAKLKLASRYGAVKVVVADDSMVANLASSKAHACINFAPTAATWTGMTAAVRPRGRIVAAAMVSEPVPLNQEWLTASGVTILGTSVGTRSEMRQVVAMHAAQPFACETTTIIIEQASEALQSLERGKATGRYVIDLR
jgi:propanol-preferring alcohol dehydrogenase